MQDSMSEKQESSLEFTPKKQTGLPSSDYCRAFMVQSVLLCEQAEKMQAGVFLL